MISHWSNIFCFLKNCRQKTILVSELLLNINSTIPWCYCMYMYVQYTGTFIYCSDSPVVLSLCANVFDVCVVSIIIFFFILQDNRSSCVKSSPTSESRRRKHTTGILLLTKNTPSVPLWWLRITYRAHLFIRNDCVSVKVNNYTLHRDFKRGQLPMV